MAVRMASSGRSFRSVPDLIDRKQLPVAAAPAAPLDLSGLRRTATIRPDDLVLVLWLLSTPEPPSLIALPESLLIRRRLGRCGLVFTADRRGVPMEIAGQPVSASEALGGGIDQQLPLATCDLENSDRMRVIFDLEKRPPPWPDVYGRHYYWMDGLGVAAGHPKRSFFDTAADQCLFELVDNVHRWAKARRAMAMVSATFGGGNRSHNRLQVVVVDDGVGIVESVRSRTVRSNHAGQLSFCLSAGEKEDEEIALHVISDLLDNVYERREVIAARGGHGLYTINRYALRWRGTVNVMSSFAESRVMFRGRRGSGGEWKNREFTLEGIKGTLVHLSLDAVNQSGNRSSGVRDRELISI